LYAPLLTPIRATWPTHFILLYLIALIIFVEEYRSSMCPDSRNEKFVWRCKNVTGTRHEVTLYIHRLSCVIHVNVGEEVDRSFQRVQEPEETPNSRVIADFQNGTVELPKASTVSVPVGAVRLSVTRSDFALRVSPSHSHELHNVNSPFPRTYLLTYSMEQSPSWEANWFCS
jgi:hypothetical protein